MLCEPDDEKGWLCFEWNGGRWREKDHFDNLKFSNSEVTLSALKKVFVEAENCKIEQQNDERNLICEK